MKKPTPKEVEAYAQTIDFDIDGEEFCSFYQSKGWLIGKSPMKDWQCAVVTWKKRDRKKQKQRLLPIIGKVCGKQDCVLPAVYKSTGSFDHYYCTEHMPEQVKEKYE